VIIVISHHARLEYVNSMLYSVTELFVIGAQCGERLPSFDINPSGLKRKESNPLSVNMMRSLKAKSYYNFQTQNGKATKASYCFNF
jgi:hypothetical protein